MNCVISVYLAYGMAVFCLATIYYFAMVRSIETPLKDSLTQKQKKIKDESVKIRRTTFLQGLVAAALLMILTQPFNKCFKGRLP